ncbi:hypothetical protein AB0D56_10060 [Streptomyces sp. NPDC048209]|uniref:hypothetical protein n=1 Tax=Streptomyces sp. NPDC048209 TaxID=3156689 RepID=UPI00342956F6
MTAPDGPTSLPPADLREQLLATLTEAGIELGDRDRLIVDWLTVSPGWGWSTVATIASWVKQAANSDAV